MEFELSPQILGALFIILGVVIVFILLDGSLGQLFGSSIQENVMVEIKQNGTCIAEAADNIPRSIRNCTYEQGDNITISYKQGLPGVQSHSQQ
ncbi:MAG: hypothetical protein L0H53_09710 [Candidatus Nitrosocosmicus sp.]|nr:hypothetical protein [Candidatus Nitrosocosmicus sp.]MDN5868243.1 hypothetical protein [Candidatus Nitrosocosmicus sp.]